VVFGGGGVSVGASPILCKPTPCETIPSHASHALTAQVKTSCAEEEDPSKNEKEEDPSPVVSLPLPPRPASSLPSRFTSLVFPDKSSAEVLADFSGDVGDTFPFTSICANHEWASDTTEIGATASDTTEIGASASDTPDEGASASDTTEIGASTSDTTEIGASTSDTAESGASVSDTADEGGSASDSPVDSSSEFCEIDEPFSSFLLKIQ